MASAALSAGALALPAQAGAYTEHFCQFATLPPGGNCLAPDRHTLDGVNAWSINAVQRVCAASFTHAWGGSQNSDWRCDYGWTYKYLGGRVDGVGAIHNGDPWWMITYGTQDF
jgi:hypothetical protein